jgi:hypothetical protein
MAFPTLPERGDNNWDVPINNALTYLAGRTYKFRGEFDQANTYDIGDVVTYGNYYFQTPQHVQSGHPLDQGVWVIVGQHFDQALSTTDSVAFANISFTPANAGDWDSAPTTVAAALDEIAARLRALEA